MSGANDKWKVLCEQVIAERDLDPINGTRGDAK